MITTPFATSRATTEGAQEAVVEFYTLAATKKILGSYWSSYSTTVSELGNILMLRITAEMPDTDVKS